MKWEYKVHMKVLLFGCGTYYRRYRHLFDGMQVAAIVDNFSSQKEMDGILDFLDKNLYTVLIV